MTYLFLAPGFEEIEAIATIDVLRRGDVDVRTISILPEKRVVGAHNVAVEADDVINNVNIADADMLVLPGGMPGASNLRACEKLTSALVGFKGHIGAICAAPAVVLGSLGMLKGKEAICYPGFENDLNCSKVSDDVVVTDGNVTTAMGPGFAMEFGLELVRIAKGDEKSDEVASGMLLL